MLVKKKYKLKAKFINPESCIFTLTLFLFIIYLINLL